MYFQSSSLVLRSYDYAEADRILVLFTRQAGKLRAVAKGVRKNKSKLAGSLNLLTLADLQFYGREQQALVRITQAQVITAYPHLKKNLDALAQASRMAELVDAATEEHQPLPELYQLLLQALAILEAGLSPRHLAVWFEIHFWERLGFGLNLESCYQCQVKDEKMSFDLEAGGLVCHNCSPHGTPAISVGARRLMMKVMAMDPRHFQRLQIQPRLEKEVREFLDKVIYYHLGKPLKSDRFKTAVDELPWSAPQGTLK